MYTRHRHQVSLFLDCAFESPYADQQIRGILKVLLWRALDEVTEPEFCTLWRIWRAAVVSETLDPSAFPIVTAFLETSEDNVVAHMATLQREQCALHPTLHNTWLDTLWEILAPSEAVLVEELRDIGLVWVLEHEGLVELRQALSTMCGLTRRLLTHVCKLVPDHILPELCERVRQAKRAYDDVLREFQLPETPYWGNPWKTAVDACMHGPETEDKAAVLLRQKTAQVPDGVWLRVNTLATQLRTAWKRNLEGSPPRPPPTHAQQRSASSPLAGDTLSSSRSSSEATPRSHPNSRRAGDGCHSTPPSQASRQAISADCPQESVGVGENRVEKQRHTKGADGNTLRVTSTRGGVNCPASKSTSRSIRPPVGFARNAAPRRVNAAHTPALSSHTVPERVSRYPIAPYGGRRTTSVVVHGRKDTGPKVTAGNPSQEAEVQLVDILTSSSSPSHTPGRPLCLENAGDEARKRSGLTGRLPQPPTEAYPVSDGSPSATASSLRSTLRASCRAVPVAPMALPPPSHLAKCADYTRHRSPPQVPLLVPPTTTRGRTRECEALASPPQERVALQAQQAESDGQCHEMASPPMTVGELDTPEQKPNNDTNLPVGERSQSAQSAPRLVHVPVQENASSRTRSAHPAPQAPQHSAHDKSGSSGSGNGAERRPRSAHSAPPRHVRPSAQLHQDARSSVYGCSLSQSARGTPNHLHTYAHAQSSRQEPRNRNHGPRSQSAPLTHARGIPSSARFANDSSTSPSVSPWESNLESEFSINDIITRRIPPKRRIRGPAPEPLGVNALMERYVPRGDRHSRDVPCVPFFALRPDLIRVVTYEDATHHLRQLRN